MARSIKSPRAGLDRVVERPTSQLAVGKKPTPAAIGSEASKPASKPDITSINWGSTGPGSDSSDIVFVSGSTQTASFPSVEIKGNCADFVSFR